MRSIENVKFVVKPFVCDYGIYKTYEENGREKEHFEISLNQRHIALEIAELMQRDYDSQENLRGL